MLKDKQLHEKLGIPLQTLHNWKKSETYTSLLYKYLTYQDEDRFNEDTEKVISYHNYDLLTPKEFSSIIEQNWGQFELFQGYEYHSTIDVKKGAEEQAATLAFKQTDNSVLLIRYIYAVSMKEELFTKEVDEMVERIKTIDMQVDSFKIIYVTTRHNPPKYFDNLKHDVRLVNYASLYEQVSNKHLLIV